MNRDHDAPLYELEIPKLDRKNNHPSFIYTKI